MTYLIRGTVSDDSATLVASTIRRDFSGLKILFCSATESRALKRQDFCLDSKVSYNVKVAKFFCCGAYVFFRGKKNEHIAGID